MNFLKLFTKSVTGTQVVSTSPSGKVGKGDFVNLAKSASIVAVGAVLTYVSEWAVGQDFGTYTPMVVLGLATAVNLFHKYFTKNGDVIVVPTKETVK